MRSRVESHLLMRRSLHDLPELPALPPGFTLREYAVSDLERLAAVLTRAFGTDDWTPGDVRRRLIDNPSVKKTLIVAKRGIAVATASARIDPVEHPGCGYVHWVASDPSERGKRLGYVATLAVLREFLVMGYREAVLETEDHRLPAVKTYLNLGFTCEPRHPSHVDRWARILDKLGAAEGE